MHQFQFLHKKNSEFNFIQNTNSKGIKVVLKIPYLLNERSYVYYNQQKCLQLWKFAYTEKIIIKK